MSPTQGDAPSRSPERSGPFGEPDPAPAWRSTPGAWAWPRGWQRPARTEEWAFEQAAEGLGCPRFARLVCFPWATLIDLVDRGREDRARPYLEALDRAPPSTTLLRATVCQHIRLERALPWMKALRITDVFWSHARVGQAELDGIRLHPFPLYPVRALDRAVPLPRTAPASESRPWLYSFVGAYSPEGYLTPVRQWILELPRRPDAVLVRRTEWHYEAMVYGEQVSHRPIQADVRTRLERDAVDYDATLQASVFSLCPSGAGPNSIRLWESLGFGCIPVLLADTLRLPGDPAEWDDAIVRVPETRDAVAALPARLQALAGDTARLQRMREAGRRLWERYGERGPLSVLGVLGDPGWVRARVAAAQAPDASADAVAPLRPSTAAHSSDAA